MAVKSRRSYKGAAVSNTLASPGLAANATSISLASAMSGWPTGSEPFFCVIDPGTSKEEKVCVIYASSTTLTVVDPATSSSWSASVNGRGADNTTDRQHDAGAAIYPVFTAYEADQANELVSKYAHTGAVVYQGASTFSELQIGTASQVLRVNSGATAPEWGQVATAGIADSAVTTAKIADTNVTTAKIADSAVTSAKIADGTIVDADINASAAIALSKLATGALPTAITVASANITDGTIVSGDLSSTLTPFLVPTGAVMPYAGTSAPTGWLFCFGQTVSRTTYASLFSALSTTYGSGDGSTTFGLPDLRGRAVAGKDDMGGTSANRLTAQSGGLNGDNLGATGGAETHTLVTGEMPSHTHSYSASASTTHYTYSATVTGSYQDSISPYSDTTGSAGSGNAHNNVQPTIILNYIIKT